MAARLGARRCHLCPTHGVGRRGEEAGLERAKRSGVARRRR